MQKAPTCKKTETKGVCFCPIHAFLKPIFSVVGRNLDAFPGEVDPNESYFGKSYQKEELALGAHFSVIICKRKRGRIVLVVGHQFLELQD